MKAYTEKCCIQNVDFLTAQLDIEKVGEFGGFWSVFGCLVWLEDLRGALKGISRENSGPII